MVLNNHQIEQLRMFVLTELKENADLFDFDAHLDRTLNYHEAKNELADKIEHLKEKMPNVSRQEANRIKEALKEDGQLIINKWLKKSLQISKVYAVIGARGKGKSCYAFAMLEWHKMVKRKCFIYNFPKPTILPKWIHNVENISEAEKGGVLLIDEAGIEFNQFSFNSAKSVELANMLKTARHRDLSIIFIAQNGANMTRDVRRLVDCYILKAPSFTQMYDEIPIIKKMYQNCFMLFSTEEQQQKGYFVSEVGEMAFFDKPEWFSNRISKSYDGEKETPNTSKFMDKIKQTFK